MEEDLSKEPEPAGKPSKFMDNVTKNLLKIFQL